jgi:hypothetical protein
MTFELYTNAVLTRDVPAHGLRAGDVVKVIDCHPAPFPCLNPGRMDLQSPRRQMP